MRSIRRMIRKLFELIWDSLMIWDSLGALARRVFLAKILGAFSFICWFLLGGKFRYADSGV